MQVTFDKTQYHVDGQVDSVLVWKNKYNALLDQLAIIMAEINYNNVALPNTNDNGSWDLMLQPEPPTKPV